MHDLATPTADPDGAPTQHANYAAAVETLAAFLDTKPDQLTVHYEDAGTLVCIRAYGIAVVGVDHLDIEFIPRQAITHVRFGSDWLIVDAVDERRAVSLYDMPEGKSREVAHLLHQRLFRI